VTDDLSRHHLSDDNLARIFAERIVEDLFADSSPSFDPLLILVGAQPGAGKTLVGNEIGAQSGQAMVPILGDNLRAYHPGYLTLLDSFPEAMPNATAQAAGRWVEMASDFAAEHRISVRIEGTWRDPRTSIDTAERFAGMGFHIEGHLLAVSPEVSHLSILKRFVDGEMSEGWARYTSLEAHDASVCGIPDTLAALSRRGGAVDRMVVRSRQRILFDRSRRPRGSFLRGGLAALQAERDRPMGDEEFARWCSQKDAAVSRVEDRYPGHEGLSRLARQLAFDQTHLEYSRAGLAYRRGRVGDGRDIPPRRGDSLSR